MTIPSSGDGGGRYAGQLGEERPADQGQGEVSLRFYFVCFVGLRMSGSFRQFIRKSGLQWAAVLKNYIWKNCLCKFILS